MLETTEYERKPFKVAAAKVTPENIELVARWTGGSVRTDADGQFVKIRTHRPLTPRQSQAYVGDRVLKTATGFKVYTEAAFDKSFVKVSDKTTTVTFPDEVAVKPKKSTKRSGPKPGPVTQTA